MFLPLILSILLDVFVIGLLAIYACYVFLMNLLFRY